MPYVKLYLAESATQTLVGRRAPACTVVVDHLTFGPVVVVRPRPDPGGLLLEPFAFPSAFSWRLLRRSRADHRLLTAEPDRADLRTAATAAILTIERWPAVGRRLDLGDPGPALAGILWDLTGTLTDRQRVRRTLAELTGLHAEMPAGSAIARETADRAGRARDRLATLDAAVHDRLEHLARLADETEAFERQQRAFDRARSVLREADYLLDAAPAGPVPAPADTARDLAERTSAMLAAYRELTG